jgi:PAS domain S-box-containing protein
MEKIAHYLFFAAFIQSVWITFVWGLRSMRQGVATLLFFLFMLGFSLVLFRVNWNIYTSSNLTSLHLPMWFAFGPILHYFVRFSFLPTKSIRSKRWLWSFVPWGFELSTALLYWLLLTVNIPWAETLKIVNSKWVDWSFTHFCLYTLATTVFLFRHNTRDTLNIVYKKQVKMMKYFLFFIILFIIDETFTAENEILFSSIILFAFVSTFTYTLLDNEPLLSSSTKQSREILKEALNEREIAVVITNKDRIVEYVNTPFLDMVGYRHRDIIGRKPAFLQGNLTTPESVHFVRTKLNERVEFEAAIVNYRKNGEAYTCHIRITPVFNNSELTHFVAYEKDLGLVAPPTLDAEEQQFYNTLKAYFETEKPYLHKQVQAIDIADYFSTTTRRLGEIIKKAENQSFSDFVNVYRIKAAIGMLQNPDFQHLTVEAIGQNCGFNSKSAFDIAFKKETGRTPSAFLADTKKT